MDILTQLTVCVPSIIAATTLLTSAIDNAFKVENNNVKHAISWIVAVLGGVLFVLAGTFNFGFGGWDYAVGAAFGLLAGGASNGLYDWPAVSNVVELFGSLFKPKTPEVEDTKE